MNPLILMCPPNLVMEINSDPSVLFEDDTFYAEIKRQILLLTSEEDDEVQTSSFNLKPKDGSIYKFKRPTTNLYLWETETSAASPPVWLMNLWKKNITGTGVFIPQLPCRENQRPGRRMNTRKAYRPVVNKA